MQHEGLDQQRPTLLHRAHYFAQSVAQASTSALTKRCANPRAP
jgi:hypothetical protein